MVSAARTAGARRRSPPATSAFPESSLLFPSSFLPLLGADYCFCAAAFCSPRLCRRGPPFPCFALSRRNCSTTSTALGRQPECLDDRLLGCVLSLIHVSALLLGRLSVSIRPDWYGLWRYSRLGRPGDDPLGKPTGKDSSTPRTAGSRFSSRWRSPHVSSTAGGTPRTPAAMLPSISIG